MTKIRCSWCEGFPEYVAYHDKEWGVPVYDDKKQFEFLILEGAQAGLSWATILKRRDGYRKAFADFNVHAIAKYDSKKIERLLLDPGIIRNRLKVTSAIENARKFIELQEEFGSFSNYIWAFVEGSPIVNKWKKLEEIPATSTISDILSSELMKRGFKFVGSTIIYAHMQACGLVNDHVVDCFRYKELT